MIIIELNEPDTEAMENIYNQMFELGFKKTIKSTEGKEFMLPDGQFQFFSSENYDFVLNLAREAVKEVYMGDFRAIVTAPTGHSQWHGLAEAED